MRREKELASTRDRLYRLEWSRFCHELGDIERSKKTPDDLRLVWESVAQSQHGLKSGDIWPLRSRNVSVGMSQCGVIAALGLPTRVHRTQTAHEDSAQWVFSRPGSDVFVYVRDGAAYAVQD